MTPIPEAQIPSELIEGIDRFLEDAVILIARLRWRPFDSDATGFLTHNRLLEVEGKSALEIGRELTTLAAHLYGQGECERRFETHLKREFEDGNREWRSITFYVPEQAEADAEEDLDDEADFEFGDPPHLEVEAELGADAGFDFRPLPKPGSPAPKTGGVRRLPPHRTTRSTPPPKPETDWGDFSRYLELSRTDPPAFAMLVMHESRVREVATLERLLGGASDRLDRVLATQVDTNRIANQSLQILTDGASRIAGVGVGLFQQGLEGQARVMEMQRDTTVGKERTELMRDAVKQGSLLIQAILMSQAAKTGTPPSSPTQPTCASASTPGNATKSSADLEVEKAARALLGLVDESMLAEVREVAPSIVALFEELRGKPVEAGTIRAIIRRAQSEVDMSELDEAGKVFPGELKAAFGRLMVLVLM